MQNWIDFESIKRAVPVLAVLKRYRVAPLRRSGRDQLRGRCPVHGGEGREAFHVNTAQQVFHCFSCGAGGSVLDLVAALEGCGLRQAAQKLWDWRAGAAWEGPPREPTVTKKREPLAPLGFRLRGVDPRHPYLSSRGIEEATAIEFGVGFYAGPGLMSRRVVIPVHDAAGRLVAYCGRSCDGSQPRYKFPSGFAKSQVLFNLHRAAATGSSTVIVVEGFFDCLKVHQAGFVCVVALMGSVLSEPQRQRLLRFREVILLLDGDVAGRRAAAAIAAQLGSVCDARGIDLDDNVQPDQLSSATLSELLVQKGGRQQVYRP